MNKTILMGNRNIVKFIVYVTGEKFTVIQGHKRLLAKFNNTKEVRAAKAQAFDILSGLDNMPLDARKFLEIGNNVDAMFVDFVKENKKE